MHRDFEPKQAVSPPSSKKGASEICDVVWFACGVFSALGMVVVHQSHYMLGRYISILRRTSFVCRQVIFISDGIRPMCFPPKYFLLLPQLLLLQGPQLRY